MDIDDIKLQPLRVPAGWHVTQNVFFEVDPDPSKTINYPPQKSVLTLFLQDMFHAKHNHYDIVVDVGWVPDEDPAGSFIVQAIRGTDWDNPIDELMSRDRLTIAQKLEAILLDVSAGKYPR